MLKIYNFRTSEAMDRTTYVSKAFSPDLALRQIFGRHRTPSELCLLFANSSLLNIETVAVLGENHAAVRASFTRLIGGEERLGADDQTRELRLIQVVTVWNSCQALNTCFAQRRAKMEEDPHKVPELSQETHGDFRAQFMTAHPDAVVNSWNEPHKKFVERINRDYTVNGTVPFYEAGEMRTRSETIAQKTGLAPSADQLVKLCKVDEASSAVATEEEVFQRLHAFFMAMEMLNICAFTAADGPVKYINELQKFRKSNPGLSTLLRADKLIRLMVAELNTDDRDNFPSFSGALLHVLDTKQYLWNDARSTSRHDVTPDRKRKLSAFEELGSPGPSTPTRSSLKRQKLKAKLAALTDGSKPAAHAKGKGKGKVKNSAAPGSARVPASEWTKLCSFKPSGPPRCRFFNSSNGCSAGGSCKQKHVCLECGGDHSWVSAHA